ncbi:MAG: SdrD B-like domain-containing protein [Candidatus Solibacter sp.]
MTLRPFRLLSLNASAGDRKYLLGEPSRTRTYTLGGTLLMPGKNTPQLGYMRTLQLDSSSLLGRFELEQYSIMLPNLGRYSASVFYTNTKLAGTRVQDVNGLLGIDMRRAGRFSLHYQSQFHSNRRYGGDWYYKFGEHDGFLRLGADMMRTYGGQTGLLPMVGLRLPLPRKQVLEISYFRDLGTQMLQLQLGGKLIAPHEILRDSRGVPRINLRTSLSGTVYTDLNYNGAFDGGDRPIANVQVWLDDKTMVSSDVRGFFRFENIEPGGHQLRAELGTVPAGFVFATAGNQTAAAVPNRENRVEFRVIRTGQITGKVIYMDYSDDADHPVEKPLADVRIVVTGDGDTYSEANGAFLLGDLPPGQYELRPDPASVPPGYVPQPSRAVVTVTPGGVSRDTVFKLAIPPRPVIQIQAPDQKIEMPVEAKPAEKPKEDRQPRDPQIKGKAG